MGTPVGALKISSFRRCIFLRNVYFKGTQRTLRGPHGILFHPEGHIIVRGRLSEGGCQRDAVRGMLSEGRSSEHGGGNREEQMAGREGGREGRRETLRGKQS